jgi:hypothetical protein
MGIYSFSLNRAKRGSTRSLTLSTEGASHKQIAVARSLPVTDWCNLRSEGSLSLALPATPCVS